MTLLLWGRLALLVALGALLAACVWIGLGEGDE